jgi:SAM-dependent methyltransferase
MAEAKIDLDYTLEDFAGEVGPLQLDSRLFFRRVEQVMLTEGTSGPPGRVLDVACGTGKQAMRMSRRGWEAWGLEASMHMIGMSRLLYPNAAKVHFVRSIAEGLPFKDNTFDRVLCQGSLDHFVDPFSFMRESARILRPSGRLVIALANYDGLSCLLGRARQQFKERLLGLPPPPFRPYWEIPPDHYHRGDLAFVQRLGDGALELERCYGISLLWLFPRFGETLDRLPRPLGAGVWNALDRIAQRSPALSDMIISVWRPLGRATDGATPPTH